MSKRFLLPLFTCIVLFGTASYLPRATQQTFGSDEISAPSTHQDESAPSHNPLVTAASFSEPAPQRDEQKITVYITNTGAKYHIGSCRYLSRSKHPISLRDAKAQGYDACKVCRPPR
jgi:hypothetical protein